MAGPVGQRGQLGHPPLCLGCDRLGLASREVFGFWGRQFQLSGGTLRISPAVIVAGDEYAFALVHATAQRNGRTLDAPGVNVVRLRDGKATEFWSYTTDRYAVDEFWS